jgi:hypothetical protein
MPASPLVGGRCSTAQKKSRRKRVVHPDLLERICQRDFLLQRLDALGSLEAGDLNAGLS